MDNFAADAIYIDAPPSRVFSALLEAEEILTWMDAETVIVEDAVGGQFTAQRRDGSTVTGSISILEPDERLDIANYYHEADGDRRGPMLLCFRLESRGDGVWLVVRQEGLDTGKDWHSFAKSARQELVAITLALKRHIEQI